VSASRKHVHLVLGLLMVIAAGLTLWWTAGRTFALDEWGYLATGADLSPGALLEPHNGHLVLTQLLLYKLLLPAFGASSHLPFDLVTVGLQLAVGAAVYAICSPRIGPWAALMPATLVLFLGAGWEIMINPAGISGQLALLAGLGALLCLEREDHLGDVLAALLLLFSVASFSTGLAVAAGCGALVVVTDRSRWRRLWVVAAPLALYGAWFLWARKFHQTELTSYAAGSLPSGVFDQLSAVLAALTGLFRQAGSPDLGSAIAELRSDRAAPLVFVLVGAVVLRIGRGPKPGPRLWAMLTIVTVYLLLIGLGLRAGRPPDASRYAYPGSVLVLLLIVELSAGLTIGRPWVIAAATVTALALIANVAQLRLAGNFFREESAYNRSELAALELSRPTVRPDYMPETGITTIFPHRDLYFTAGEYFSATEDFGSPAYSPSELAAAAPGPRAAADIVLGEALGLAPAPIRGLPRSRGSAPPRPIKAVGGRVTRRGSCLRFSPGRAGDSGLSLYVPPGGFAYRSGPSSEAAVSLGRYANDFPISLAPVRGTALVRIPRDASAQPWRAQFETAEPLTVCPP